MELHLHFESRRILRVEAPHSPGTCRSCGPATTASAAAGGFPVQHKRSQEYVLTANCYQTNLIFVSRNESLLVLFNDNGLVMVEIQRSLIELIELHSHTLD